MPQKKIRTLVVDDSAMFRTVITSALTASSDIEIIGTAVDAMEANDKILSLNPDVVTLDVEMPKMNGIEFLKKLVPKQKVAVIVVTSSAVEAFEATAAGAVDFIKKPSAKEMDSFAHELRKAVRVASTARVGAGRLFYAAPAAPLPNLNILNIAGNANKVIAIGASTGGTDAIQAVVQDLPANTPGTVIVQHMPAGFTKMYADRLNRACKMEVREAQDGDRLKQGLILIGAGEFHLRLKRDVKGYYVECKRGEKVSGHCPSVDVLFESVAETAKNGAIGVILTGMGADGAKGLLSMKNAGAYTIGQDKETCIVYGMPMVAFNMGGVVRQAPLQNITAMILERLR
ncbi:MAG: chemotaxis response regulator protein-glutamate methylesterase [Oscillospiraceae bacterium]|jgi:two-component system chemotaxis response regulator CheB|nr:chemotaxis response regulator protein-glutamate methylesterase [Oscillospiraceae bacterium]